MSTVHTHMTVIQAKSDTHTHNTVYDSTMTQSHATVLHPASTLPTSTSDNTVGYVSQYLQPSANILRMPTSNPPGMLISPRTMSYNTAALNLPSHLNRQFSTDQLHLSPYSVAQSLTSPQLTSIPGLGLSQAYMNQLQSPQLNRNASYNSNTGNISAITLPSPVTTLPTRQPSSVIHSHTSSTSVSTIPPVTTAPLRMRRCKDRPVVKLTRELMNTYNSINETYYKHKQQRQAEQQQQSAPVTHTLDNTTSSIAGVSDVKRTGVNNNGCDDKDYNYIVVPNERIGYQQRYIVESSIGKGSFGRVVKCFDRVSQQWVAVKVVKSKPAFHRQAQVEINVLQSLASDAVTADKYNVVHMLDTFVHQNHQCIVFELLSLNLYELLRNTRFNGVSLKLVAKFAHQLLQTLWYLNSNIHAESKRVLHCDLKPENILLRNLNKSAIKVVDFGSACFASQKSFTYIQSRFYRAPEILLGLPYNAAIDMFSLGCILVELHTGRPLFDGTCETDQVVKQYDILGCPPHHMLHNNSKAAKFYDHVQSGATTTYKLKADLPVKTIRKQNSSIRAAIGDKWQNTELYELFEDFVSQMLMYDPALRIKPVHALSHPFLQAVASTSSSTQANAAHTSTVSTTVSNVKSTVTQHSTVSSHVSTTVTTTQPSYTDGAVNGPTTVVHAGLNSVHPAVAPDVQPPVRAHQMSVDITPPDQHTAAPSQPVEPVQRAIKRPLAQLTKHKTWTQMHTQHQPVRAMVGGGSMDTTAYNTVSSGDATFSPNSTSSTVCNSVSETHSYDPFSQFSPESINTPMSTSLKSNHSQAHAAMMLGEQFVLPPQVHVLRGNGSVGSGVSSVSVTPTVQMVLQNHHASEMSVTSDSGQSVGSDNYAN